MYRTWPIDSVNLTFIKYKIYMLGVFEKTIGVEDEYWGDITFWLKKTCLWLKSRSLNLCDPSVCFKITKKTSSYLTENLGKIFKFVNEIQLEKILFIHLYGKVYWTMTLRIKIPNRFFWSIIVLILPIGDLNLSYSKIRIDRWCVVQVGLLHVSAVCKVCNNLSLDCLFVQKMCVDHWGFKHVCFEILF